jgi:hypothetical protein
MQADLIRQRPSNWRGGTAQSWDQNVQTPQYLLNPDVSRGLSRRVFHTLTQSEQNDCMSASTTAYADNLSPVGTYVSPGGLLARTRKCGVLTVQNTERFQSEHIGSTREHVEHEVHMALLVGCDPDQAVRELLAEKVMRATDAHPSVVQRMLANETRDTRLLDRALGVDHPQSPPNAMQIDEDSVQLSDDMSLLCNQSGILGKRVDEFEDGRHDLRMSGNRGGIVVATELALLTPSTVQARVTTATVDTCPFGQKKSTNYGDKRVITGCDGANHSGTMCDGSVVETRTNNASFPTRNAPGTLAEQQLHQLMFNVPDIRMQSDNNRTVGDHLPYCEYGHSFSRPPGDATEPVGEGQLCELDMETLDALSSHHSGWSRHMQLDRMVSAIVLPLFDAVRRSNTLRLGPDHPALRAEDAPPLSTDPQVAMPDLSWWCQRWKQLAVVAARASMRQHLWRAPERDEGLVATTANAAPSRPLAKEAETDLSLQFVELLGLDRHPRDQVGVVRTTTLIAGIAHALAGSTQTTLQQLLNTRVRSGFSGVLPMRQHDVSGEFTVDMNGLQPFPASAMVTRYFTRAFASTLQDALFSEDWQHYHAKTLLSFRKRLFAAQVTPEIVNLHQGARCSAWIPPLHLQELTPAAVKRIEESPWRFDLAREMGQRLLLRGFDSLVADLDQLDDPEEAQQRRSVFTSLPMRCISKEEHLTMNEQENKAECARRDAWFADKLSQTGLKKIKVNPFTGEIAGNRVVVGLSTCMVLEKESDAYKTAGACGPTDAALNPAKDVAQNPSGVRFVNSLRT